MVYQPRRSISIDETLSKSYWTWRSNPALTVPTMFSTSLEVLAQSILGLAAVGLVVRLERTDWLQQMMTAVSGRDYSGVSRLLTSSDFVFSALLLLVPAILVALVVIVLASGFVYSAEFGSYWMALQGSHVGVPQVMTKFRERWREMAWTYLLSYLVTLSPLMASLLAAAALFTGIGGFTALVAIIVLVAGLAATLFLCVLLIYVPVVVMAEGLSGRAAIYRSMAVGRRNFGISLTYGVVYVSFTTGITFVSSLVPGASLPLSSLAAVGVLILVTPVLHLSKTCIFRDSQSALQGPPGFLPPFSSDVRQLLGFLWRTFLVGLKELKEFVLDLRNLPYHIVSSLSILVGWFVGLYVEENGLTKLLISLGYSTGKINPLVSGSLPLTLGIYIFFHNWQVSLATALSGVWFSFAPFLTLFLNGVLVGAVSGLAPNVTMLAAALLPHGIIEIPSLVLAGSAGIKLGVSFLRAVRSEDIAATGEFHQVSRQTIYVVVGLALLFFIAGLIEGNVTPIIMKMAGWS